MQRVKENEQDHPPECMEKCVQKEFDRADIVRDVWSRLTKRWKAVRLIEGHIACVRNQVYFVIWPEAKERNFGRIGGVMKRRDFLRSAGVVSAALAFPKTRHLLAYGAAPDAWRTFEVTASVQVLKPSGMTRIWLPAALVNSTPFQKTLANDFKAEDGTAKMVESGADSLGIIAAEFPAGVKPVLTVTSRIATKNYAVDLSAAGKAPKEGHAELEHFLRPTKLLPIDGIVRTTATEITKDAKTDVEKARAIYEWIVENTFRNPKTRGCGLGDIRFKIGRASC